MHHARDVLDLLSSAREETLDIIEGRVRAELKAQGVRISDRGFMVTIQRDQRSVRLRIWSTVNSSPRR